jgi:Xaa-Pro aminopeptidase
VRFPEFDKREFEHRWQRARTLMAEAQLDALFITSTNNFRYLSGHVTPFWVSKTRPLFFLLPLRRDPILLVTTNQVETAQATSWVEEVRSWEGFATAGVELVAQTIRDLGLTSGRIGAELGYEQRLGLPYHDFVHLQHLLPQATFVDAADLLWQLRQVKSAAEIAYLRQAATITNNAYQEIFHTVQEGMTEQEVFVHFVSSVFRQGAERPGYIPMHSGEGNYRRYATNPTNRLLRQGDLLWMDGGCVYHGYWADCSRLMAIGQASAQQQEHYRQVRAIMHKCLHAVRPGVSMATLARLAMQEFETAGLPFSSYSRIGHGLGLDITEPPSINHTDPTIIQPGMILTMEPTSATDFGFFQLEENYVVTPEGYALLTEPAPEELPILRS